MNLLCCLSGLEGFGTCWASTTSDCPSTGLGSPVTQSRHYIWVLSNVLPTYFILIIISISIVQNLVLQGHSKYTHTHTHHKINASATMINPHSLQYFQHVTYNIIKDKFITTKSNSKRHCNKHSHGWQQRSDDFTQWGGMEWRQRKWTNKASYQRMRDSL